MVILKKMGIIAIQVAKIAGAPIVVLCSKHQMDIASGLGADIILDRQASYIHLQMLKKILALYQYQGASSTLAARRMGSPHLVASM